MCSTGLAATGGLEAGGEHLLPSAKVIFSHKGIKGWLMVMVLMKMAMMIMNMKTTMTMLSRAESESNS